MCEVTSPRFSMHEAHAQQKPTAVMMMDAFRASAGVGCAFLYAPLPNRFVGVSDECWSSSCAEPLACLRERSPLLPCTPSSDAPVRKPEPPPPAPAEPRPGVSGAVALGSVIAYDSERAPTVTMKTPNMPCGEGNSLLRYEEMSSEKAGLNERNGTDTSPPCKQSE